MQHLILRPGPQLVMREFRPEPNDFDARPNEVDVTDRAHEFLFELITLHAGATLADIFRLLDASPLLRMIYRRDLADELCALARQGPTATTDSGRAAHEGIEYLELYQQWGLDTSKDEYSGMQHLELHGVGHELADDLPEQHKKKGERIEWSVSLAPLRELLSLPVKVSAEVRITEEDDAAKAWMREIRRARNIDVTLGQIIQGLLWELSFHGGPQEQQQMLDCLKRQVAEIDAGTATLIPHDDLFSDLDQPGCDALFDDLGGRSPREIGRAVRDIEDSENAAEWLLRVFDGTVVVKAPFRDRTGREFRRAFGDARRADKT